MDVRARTTTTRSIARPRRSTPRSCSRSPTAAAAASRSSSAPSRSRSPSSSSELLKDTKYIQELGRTALAQAEKLERRQGGRTQVYLSDIGAYLTEIGSKPKSNADPIPHQVLNARYHEQEASIVAQAGVPGGVTIATNMAGRGTDIQLGGNADYRSRTGSPRTRRPGARPTEHRSPRRASACRPTSR